MKKKRLSGVLSVAVGAMLFGLVSNVSASLRDVDLSVEESQNEQAEQQTQEFFEAEVLLRNRLEIYESNLQQDPEEEDRIEYDFYKNVAVEEVAQQLLLSRNLLNKLQECKSEIARLKAQLKKSNDMANNLEEQLLPNKTQKHPEGLQPPQSNPYPDTNPTSNNAPTRRNVHGTNNTNLINTNTVNNSGKIPMRGMPPVNLLSQNDYFDSVDFTEDQNNQAKNINNQKMHLHQQDYESDNSSISQSNRARGTRNKLKITDNNNRSEQPRNKYYKSQNQNTDKPQVENNIRSKQQRPETKMSEEINAELLRMNEEQLKRRLTNNEHLMGKVTSPKVVSVYQNENAQIMKRLNAMQKHSTENK